jgi:endonuclease-8
MPEGDTISKLARALGSRLRGAEVVALRLKRATGPALAGVRILDVRSRGKHLFIEFGNGVVLRSHLGMYGSWHHYPRGAPWRKPAWQASIVLQVGEETLVCFNAREAELLTANGYRLGDVQRRLGPDLTRERPEAGLLLRRAGALAEPGTLLVDLLLDQRLASGIGNVYKSEVLFLEGQPPRRTFAETPREVLAALYDLAGDLLRRNLGGGPRVTRFVGDGRGNLWVYGRADSPCFRCGSPIRRERMGVNQRSTYWCPLCQDG